MFKNEGRSTCMNHVQEMTRIERVFMTLYNKYAMRCGNVRPIEAPILYQEFVHFCGPRKMCNTAGESNIIEKFFDQIMGPPEMGRGIGLNYDFDRQGGRRAPNIQNNKITTTTSYASLMIRILGNLERRVKVLHHSRFTKFYDLLEKNRYKFYIAESRLTQVRVGMIMFGRDSDDTIQSLKRQHLVEPALTQAKVNMIMFGRDNWHTRQLLKTQHIVDKFLLDWVFTHDRKLYDSALDVLRSKYWPHQRKTDHTGRGIERGGDDNDDLDTAGYFLLAFETELASDLRAVYASEYRRLSRSRETNGTNSNPQVLEHDDLSSALIGYIRSAYDRYSRAIPPGFNTRIYFQELLHRFYNDLPVTQSNQFIQRIINNRPNVQHIVPGYSPLISFLESSRDNTPFSEHAYLLEVFEFNHEVARINWSRLTGVSRETVQDQSMFATNLRSPDPVTFYYQNLNENQYKETSPYLSELPRNVRDLRDVNNLHNRSENLSRELVSTRIPYDFFHSIYQRANWISSFLISFNNELKLICPDITVLEAADIDEIATVIGDNVVHGYYFTVINDYAVKSEIQPLSIQPGDITPPEGVCLIRLIPPTTMQITPEPETPEEIRAAAENPPTDDIVNTNGYKIIITNRNCSLSTIREKYAAAFHRLKDEKDPKFRHDCNVCLRTDTRSDVSYVVFSACCHSMCLPCYFTWVTAQGSPVGTVACTMCRVHTTVIYHREICTDFIKRNFRH